MERRELVFALGEYIKSLPVEDRFCNDCVELQIKEVHGARGQGIMPFHNGVCRCDVEGLMWEYRNPSVDRPIECILNGVKQYRR